VAAEARELAEATVAALDGVGIFAVEFLLDRDDRLWVNEVAPRPHNSGHFSIEACMTDQYEQHLRAILDLPLGSTELLHPAAMVNLLGAPEGQGPPAVEGLAEALALPGVHLHLYGKQEVRPWRKMGHVTVLADCVENALARARQVKRCLQVVAGP